MEEKRYDALEQALTELTSGQEADGLIEANPELAAEIEAAQLARSLSEATIPQDAAHRSRTRMLARAMELRPEVQPPRGIFQRLPRLVWPSTRRSTRQWRKISRLEEWMKSRAYCLRGGLSLSSFLGLLSSNGMNIGLSRISRCG
jgi:hypothetical protein